MEDIELNDELIQKNEQNELPSYNILQTDNIVPTDNVAQQNQELRQQEEFIARIENEALNDDINRREERRRRYEENNPPKEMTVKLILWRMTHYSLFNDILHIAMLYAYCKMNSNIRNNIVSQCILIKIVLWFFPFISRTIAQPYIDYKRIGQSFRPKEMKKFTICASKVNMIYNFVAMIFIFADIIIINNFIPVQKSCGAYDMDMCTIQKSYSILCIFSYSIILFVCFCFLLMLMAPSIKTKLNEWTYAMNVAGLQHLTISENDDDKDCPICFEIMKEATGLPCGHKFCDNCIKPWIKEKGSCPTCFQPVFSKKTTDLHVYEKGHKYKENEEEKTETKNDSTLINEIHPLDSIV